MPDQPTPTPDDAPDMVEMTAAAICNNDNHGVTWDKVRHSTAERYRRLARRTLNVVAPEIERQVRERTLREAADLLDSKPLHCEEHGSVTCTECPVGSDWLRVEADRIARGEAR